MDRRTQPARCGRSKRKFWLKGANGCASAWSKNSRSKPTSRVGFPPQSNRGMWHARRQILSLRTSVGDVEVQVWYGYDPTRRRWGCPMRQRWGLLAYQRFSPALEERALFTATATGTYEQAAMVVRKWGCAMDGSTLHALVQRAGARAEAQTQARLKTLPQEMAPARAPSELAVTMVDGFLARFRGPGWGKERTQKARVEWHE